MLSNAPEELSNNVLIAITSSMRWSLISITNMVSIFITGKFLDSRLPDDNVDVIPAAARSTKMFVSWTLKIRVVTTTKTWWLRAPWQDPYAIKCTRGTFEGINCDNFKQEMIFDVNYKYVEQMANELQMKSRMDDRSLRIAQDLEQAGQLMSDGFIWFLSFPWFTLFSIAKESNVQKIKAFSKAGFLRIIHGVRFSW